MVRATVHGWIIESEDFQGCIFVNVAMEFPLPHDPAHVAAAANKKAIEEIIYEIAERAGAADPQALTEELCLVMEGTYVTRQVTGNPATIAIARRVTDRLIAAHLGHDRTRPPEPRLESPLESTL